MVISDFKLYDVMDAPHEFFLARHVEFSAPVRGSHGTLLTFNNILTSSVPPFSFIRIP